MNRKDVIYDTALAMRVKRYHTWPVVHQETVGEHSARVATIYGEVFGVPDGMTLWVILTHDLSEIATGDPPFPVKSEQPALKAVYNDLEKEWCKRVNGPYTVHLSSGTATQDYIKICDLLQMWEFGCIEMRLGNTFASPIISETLFAARALAAKTGVLSQIERWMTERWK